jgi:CheY-like chemotaxis protein
VGPATSGEEASGRDREAGGRRILVVEDDWIIAIQIETQLVAKGYAVVGVAADAANALALAERERPDLVLMDIRILGPVDGIEAARAIFERLGIRSLFVSAHSDAQTKARGEVAKPAGWLPKPFTDLELARAVQAAFDNQP